MSKKSSNETATSTKPVNTNKAKKTAGASLLAIVSILIAIAAILAAGYLYLYTQQLTASQHQQLTNLQSQYTELDSKLNQLNSDITAQKNTLTSLNQQQATIHSDANNPQYVLARSENLLYLAKYNLLYEQNSNAAIALLASIDQQLKRTNDPRLLNFRQAIINELTALKQTADVDQAGIIMKLNALANQVGNLPLAPNLPAVTADTNTAAANTQSRWERAWLTFKDIFNKALIIRYDEKAETTVLSPSTRNEVIQMIQLQLSEAAFAVLHRQADVYQASLNQAMQLLTKNFAAENSSTSAMLQQLSQLKQTNIKPNLPSLDAVFTALDQAKTKLNGQTKES